MHKIIRLSRLIGDSDWCFYKETLYQSEYQYSKYLNLFKREHRKYNNGTELKLICYKYKNEKWQEIGSHIV